MSSAQTITFWFHGSLGGALFFVPFDLIQVRGYSPAGAGAALLPFVLLVSAMSRWAGGLTVRFGARSPLVAGPLVAAVGFALLAAASKGGTYWATFFPGIFVLGMGMGITVAPLTAVVMGSVDANRSGVASGINNAVSRAGALLAVAAFGVVLLARFDDVLDARLAAMSLPESAAVAVDSERAKLGGADFSGFADADLGHALRAAFDEAYVAGFRTLMIASAALAALGALSALVLVEGAITPKPNSRGASSTDRS